MLLACYSHKHISYRIRTIIRKAILCRREPSYRDSFAVSLNIDPLLNCHTLT
ncbi:hypothetical protein [Wolbachia endosymbiont (group A) of Gymnosoma rotundatum]|uniref:hypothetical protein n=1 Tax=Wolbachia endosymbiont (group A) of Gymnosoma rotundatum TaxID=2954016 RepID=UPI0022261F63|nr:hypothetical protein [Wolbachia endosymbiont (group A) of Gymnosoma rotundatum]